MEKLEVQKDPLNNARIFEMVGNSMNSGSRDAIEHGDEITGVPVDRDVWAVDFRGRRMPHYIFRLTAELCVCSISTFDTDSSSFQVHGLHPDKDVHPDEIIYLDEIIELYYVKSVGKDRTEPAATTPHTAAAPRPTHWYESKDHFSELTKIQMAGLVDQLEQSLGIEGVLNAFEVAMSTIDTAFHDGMDAKDVVSTLVSLNEIQAFTLRNFNMYQSGQQHYKRTF